MKLTAKLKIKNSSGVNVFKLINGKLMKYCKICNRHLPATEETFGKKGIHLQTNCKACRSAIKRNCLPYGVEKYPVAKGRKTKKIITGMFGY